MLRWWPTIAALDPSAYYAASGKRHGRGPPGAGITMGVFIAWPWLALIPAAVFLAIYRLSRRKVAAGSALAWLGYALYEYAIYRRWLCSGECNIRVDLLLLYPALVVISVAGAVAALRTLIARHGRAP